jgi:excisionase family DNA binding protein
MIWDNPVLERMVEKETFVEIICSLTPGETAVALLRVDGLDDQEIADALGITRSAVHMRIKAAVKRITQQVPEARALLAGRNRFSTASRCLTGREEDDTVSAVEAARLLSCSDQTIRNWIAAGRLPNAQLGPKGSWQIPWSDLQTLL